jgi:hypothetical protein
MLPPGPPHLPRSHRVGGRGKVDGVKADGPFHSGIVLAEAGNQALVDFNRVNSEHLLT